MSTNKWTNKTCTPMWYLPPAYVVRRQLCFPTCPSIHRGGGWHPSLGLLLLSLGWGGGGTSVSGRGNRYPSLWSVVLTQGGTPVCGSRTGVHPPTTTTQNQDGCAAWAVCLLRSRRTVLLCTVYCFYTCNMTKFKIETFTINIYFSNKCP